MFISTSAKGLGARELTVVDLSDIRSALLEVWVLVVLEETLDEALEDVKGDLPLPASLQLLVQDDGDAQSYRDCGVQIGTALNQLLIGAEEQN